MLLPISVLRNSITSFLQKLKVGGAAWVIMRQWLTNWLCDSIEFNPPAYPRRLSSLCCVLMLICCQWSHHSSLLPWLPGSGENRKPWPVTTGSLPGQSSSLGQLTSPDASLIGHRPWLPPINSSIPRHPGIFQLISVNSTLASVLTSVLGLLVSPSLASN